MCRVRFKFSHIPGAQASGIHLSSFVRFVLSEGDLDYSHVEGRCEITGGLFAETVVLSFSDRRAQVWLPVASAATD